ncbi:MULTISPECIES: hypothetical protein [Morganellaceae]|uniref:Uncharacterized protein n=1 Tax=Morganella psychrotolerans TaxID=368603 RepID=A0A1B8HME2_9GAMM|nr:hypothetical protein [Morganella psychrotolerans]OBU10583.1 hypothetical protein AYY17_15695 [Morganella psychrotolerans]
MHNNTEPKTSFVINLPTDLHKDSQALVLKTAEVVAEKMRATELKRGLTNEWAKPDWESACINDFLRHVDKGDPRDLAVYANMMIHHGWTTKDAVKNVIGQVFEQASEEQEALTQLLRVVFIDAGLIKPETPMSGAQMLMQADDLNAVLRQSVVLPEMTLDHVQAFHYAFCNFSDEPLGPEEADNILTGLKAVVNSLQR